VVSDYELVQMIGLGSYGEVWRGRSVLGEFRAIKVVHRSRFAEARPFEREFEGIRRFEPISRSHPSQLAILHVGKSEELGCFYYVMELADKAEGATSAVGPEEQSLGESFDAGRRYWPRTLRSELDARGLLPPRECVQVGLSLATALAHLHRHGLVHRDIKPSNILFVNGVPKLGDIGLVTQAGDTQSIVGTEGYIPPEGPGTEQADIFSLGMVLYETSTGMDRRRYPELPPNLQPWPGDSFAAFNRILLRASARDSARRFQSASELTHRLERLVRGESDNPVKRWSGAALAKAGMLLRACGHASSALKVISSSSASRRFAWSKDELANEAYRTGLAQFRSGSADFLVKAAGAFNRAIELDPQFAAAYARLALVGLWQGAPAGDSRVLLNARAAAERAVALDGAFAEGHGVLGPLLLICDRNLRRAHDELSRAFRAAPDSEDVVYEYANCMLVRGQAGAALQLIEPLLGKPNGAALRLQNAAWIFLTARQYDRALAKLDELIERQPASRKRLAYLRAAAFWEKGEYLKALQVERDGAGQPGSSAPPDPGRLDVVEAALRAGGEKAYWEQQLAWALQDKAGFVALAAIHGRLGAREPAFECLKHALDSTPYELVHQLNTNPGFDSLRADPRFYLILRRLGLAD
jgi:serine/threonine protein kinase